MAKIASSIHWGALGIFLDFARRYTKLGGKNEAMDRLEGIMEKLAQYPIKKIDFFTWVCDMTAENKYISALVPWKRRWHKGRRSYDLDLPREKFDRVYWRFCSMLKKYHKKPIATLCMRHKYHHSLLGSNVQGIHSMGDQEWIYYMIQLNDRIADVETKVYGDEYRQWRKASNEWSHRSHNFGSDQDDAGHNIAEYHLGVFQGGKKIDLDRYIVDVSGSDFAKACLTYRSLCPKCEKYYFDGLNYGTLDENGNMRAIPEYHGYSIEENLDGDFEDFLWGADRYPQAKYHEDGGAGIYKHLARGYAVGGFVVGDEAQTKAFGLKLWTRAKAAQKHLIYSQFPIETLILEADGEYREDYRVETINWDRMDAICEAHQMVY